MFGLFRIVVLGGLLTAATTSGFADTPTKADKKDASSSRVPERKDAFEVALGEAILGQGDAEAALSRWCEARLPEGPRPKNAREWQDQTERIRRRALDDVMFRGRAAQWPYAPLRVEWRETIPGGPGYRIRKFRYEAVPGLWIPGLVYLPERLSGKVPAVLNFHGHAHDVGKAYEPKQIRCINLAKRGLIAMSPEWLWTGQLQHSDYSHERAPLLDLCGASGMAPFYLSMSRAMDILMSMEHVDPNRVGVTGLSGGGWQTITFCGLDTRAALVAPNAGYASLKVRLEHFESLGDYEQAPCDLGEFCDYTHLTAMVAPRPLLMIYNIRDNCCFAGDSTLAPLVAAALPVYRMFGDTRHCQWHVNHDPGTHNYERDNREAFYRAVNEFLLAENEQVDPTEIPSDGELKKPDELAVELPENNATFQTLATGLMRDLPRDATAPSDPSARRAWIDSKRTDLREVVRPMDLPARGVLVNQTQVPVTSDKDARAEDGSTTSPDESGTTGATTVTIRRWKIEMGPYWTMPAVEIPPQGEPNGTVILMADQGRAAARKRAAELVEQGRRVLIVDPFLIGEQAPARQFSFVRLAELVQSMGGRVLGIGASQVAAVARWTRGQYPGRVMLDTSGPRTGLVALTAAALEPDLFDGLETRESLETLKEVVRRNWTFADMPEATCFGLLEVVDIEQLRALGANGKGVSKP